MCSNHNHNLLYWKQCTLAKLLLKKFPEKGLRNLNYGCKKWNFFVHRIGIHIMHTRTHGICVTSTTELKMSINLPLLMFNFLKFLFQRNTNLRLILNPSMLCVRFQSLVNIILVCIMIQFFFKYASLTI